MTAVVLSPKGRDGKRYRSVNGRDRAAVRKAQRAAELLRSETILDLPVIPHEPLAYHPQYMLVREYGLDEWGKLFGQRQLVALTAFSRLVEEARGAMRSHGQEDAYCDAVATYLGLAVDRLANQHNTLCRWHVGGEKLEGAFARQALPMVWDFAEGNPLSGLTGDFLGAVGWIEEVVLHASLAARGKSAASVHQRNAAIRVDRTEQIGLILTDPPYYDAINYADLSDFFHVWLKRTIGSHHRDLLSLPLTPKGEQMVMNVHGVGAGTSADRRTLARRRYVDGMARAFDAMAAAMPKNGTAGVVFAHTSPDAWSTLIEGLLAAGLIPMASWPIDTEMATKTTGLGQARLRTSVWMACSKRDSTGSETFLSDVLNEMRPVIRERLLHFWSRGIRGADFFISAIGPALSVFGRQQRVLDPGGSEVSVRDFLDIVRRESTSVALEQILQGADLGAVDSVTRNYVTWVWSYSRAALDAGEALALCLATGTRLDEITRDHGIGATSKQGSKKVVKLRTVAERAREDDDLGGESAGLTTPLIDQLQCAAWLWSQNQGERLSKYRGALGETRWSALLTLGQAIAECLPEGDEDRRIIHGLLGATVRAMDAPSPSPQLSLGLDNGDGRE